jgi:hypothetical protein
MQIGLAPGGGDGIEFHAPHHPLRQVMAVWHPNCPQTERPVGLKREMRFGTSAARQRAFGAAGFAGSGMSQVCSQRIADEYSNGNLV